MYITGWKEQTPFVWVTQYEPHAWGIEFTVKWMRGLKISVSGTVLLFWRCTLALSKSSSSQKASSSSGKQKVSWSRWSEDLKILEFVSHRVRQHVYWLVLAFQMHLGGVCVCVLMDTGKLPESQGFPKKMRKFCSGRMEGIQNGAFTAGR